MTLSLRFAIGDDVVVGGGAVEVIKKFTHYTLNLRL